MTGETPGEGPGPQGREPSQQLTAGFDPEELRTRLHAAVHDVRPREDSLEYLRWAVPHRRRRRAVVAASSATLVIVSAVVIGVGSQLGLVPHGTGSASSALALNGTGSVTSGDDGGSNQGAEATQSRDDSPGSKGGVGQASSSTSPGPGSTSPGSSPPIATSPGSTGTAAAPACAAASFSGVTFGPTTVKNGITYGTVTGVAGTACVLTGPPDLTLTASAEAPSATLVADTTGAEGLPDVTSWGAKITLAAGASFQFQFAWVPTGCPTQSPGPTSTGTATGTSAPTTSSSPTQPASSTYALTEQIGGTTVASLNTLTAACGATTYYTDVYRAGAYASGGAASGN